MSSSMTAPSPGPSSASSPFVSTAISLLPGLSSGLTKLTLGYPLDTLKILLQTQQQPSSSPSSSSLPRSRFPIIALTRETLKNEGLKGLYRGCSLPGWAWGLTDGVLLSVLWEARRALWAEGEGRFTEVDPKRKAGEGDIGRRLSLGGHLIAGCIAGLSVVPIAHPIDHVKCKIQHSLLSPSTGSLPQSSSEFSSTFSPARSSPFPQFPPSSPLRPPYTHSLPASTPSLHRSYLSSLSPKPTQPLVPLTPWPLFLSLLSTGTLYKGVGWSTLIRFGQGGLFLTYEVVLRGLHRVESPFLAVAAQRRDGDWIPRNVQTLVAGSVASLVFWTMFLPADTIKSRLLTSSTPSPPSARSFRSPTSLQIIRKIYNGSSSSSFASPSSFSTPHLTRPSLRNFYKGGAAVALRAGMVNGLALMVWEGVLKGLGEESLS